MVWLAAWKMSARAGAKTKTAVMYTAVFNFLGL
jgi:hypothetical protein